MFEILVLDLNMPIMTGNEACVKITSLFEKQELMRINAVAQFSRDNQALTMMKFPEEFDVPLRTLMPVIIGCTSEILTLELLEQCDLEGFRFLFNAPLKPEELKTEIYPMLHWRQNTILVHNMDLMFSGMKNHPSARERPVLSLKKGVKQAELP